MNTAHIAIEKGYLGDSLGQFRESFRYDFNGFLDFIEEIGTTYPLKPASFDVETLEGFEQLTELEKEVALGVVYEELGVYPVDLPVERYYFSTPTNKQVLVSVFPTIHSDLGIYLHEITFPNGHKHLIIGLSHKI